MRLNQSLNLHWFLRTQVPSQFRQKPFLHLQRFFNLYGLHLGIRWLDSHESDAQLRVMTICSYFPSHLMPTITWINRLFSYIRLTFSLNLHSFSGIQSPNWSRLYKGLQSHFLSDLYIGLFGQWKIFPIASHVLGGQSEWVSYISFLPRHLCPFLWQCPKLQQTKCK